MLNNLFEFMTLAFPKAGVQVGVPLTIAMFLFLFSLYQCQYQVLPALLHVKGLVWFYTVFLIFALLAFIFNLGYMPTFQLTAFMVIVASPLAIGIGRSIRAETAIKILAFSVIIVGLYALIQRFFSILNTSIPGVSYTFGQDLTAKPIGYGMAASGDAQKMPSTYQNGNGSGLFYAMAIPILTSWTTAKGKLWLLKTVAVLCGIIGLLLSGSRSIIIPFALIFIPYLILWKGKLSYRKQLLFFALVMFSTELITIYLLKNRSEFLQQLYTRYIEQTLSDPTGAGRTSELSAAIEQASALNWLHFIRFLLIGMPWNRAIYVEGLYYALQIYGLVGFLSLTGVFISAIISIYHCNKPASIGFICVFAAFLVDGSFMYPPAMMNYFFLTGLLTQRTFQESDEYVQNSVPANQHFRLGGTYK